MNFPESLPNAHKRLLIKIIEELSKDFRILGIGAGGSYASDTMDKYSDLDLVVAVDPHAFESVMTERFEIIGRVEGKVAAFTGEHVGEPRLVIAMYGPDAIHVDFKFVVLPDSAARVDDTKVLWERGTLLSDIYLDSTHAYPQPDHQWIEDRFWIWIHYAATKVARGEYFESLDFQSFLRLTILGPLALKQGGHTPAGVRKIENICPTSPKSCWLPWQSLTGNPSRRESGSVSSCIFCCGKTRTWQSITMPKACALITSRENSVLDPKGREVANLVPDFLNISGQIFYQIQHNGCLYEIRLIASKEQGASRETAFKICIFFSSPFFVSVRHR